MANDVSPILDRRTQDALGSLLRTRLDDARRVQSSKELDLLLASLRTAEEGPSEPRQRRA